MTCDHPAIHPVLQEDQNARTASLRLFEREAEEISSDGAHLWVYRDGDAMPDEHEVAQLEKLRAALAAVPAANLDLLHDRFFWRALLVESIAWSLAIYGVAARGVPGGYFLGAFDGGFFVGRRDFEND